MQFDELKFDAKKLIRKNSAYDDNMRQIFKKHTNYSNVVYFFFSKGACIYIGESGTTLYDRCYTHENPHTDKSWFVDADEVKVIIFDDCIDDIARHAIEQTFILSYRPANNSK